MINRKSPSVIMTSFSMRHSCNMTAPILPPLKRANHIPFVKFPLADMRHVIFFRHRRLLSLTPIISGNRSAPVRRFLSSEHAQTYLSCLTSHISPAVGRSHPTESAKPLVDKRCYRVMPILGCTPWNVPGKHVVG